VPTRILAKEQRLKTKWLIDRICFPPSDMKFSKNTFVNQVIKKGLANESAEVEPGSPQTHKLSDVAINPFLPAMTG
jgi:hypothetical protein